MSRFLAIWLSLAGAVCALAAGSPKATPPADSRHQDEAYVLLIEAYRQMQTLMIEADYESRLKAAAQVKETKTREQIEALAAQEREARLKKLGHMLEGFTAAYESSSSSSEKQVDTKVAGEKLRRMVPATPKNLGPADNQPSRLLPAGAQIVYGQQP